MARPKPFRQALNGFPKDKQLVQNCRLRLEVIQESGFVKIAFEHDH